jgi:hypothetical protein
MLETSLVFKEIFLYDPRNSFSNKYLQYFTAMHNVTKCGARWHTTWGCYTTVLEQCKCTFKYHYIYFIIIRLSNLITVAIFLLIIYAALTWSWIKNTNANYGFMITY